MKPKPVLKSLASASPASTLPMFRDEVDQAASVTPISEAARRRRHPTSPAPVFGKNLRPPALIVDDGPPAADTLESLIAADADAEGEPTGLGPGAKLERITRAGPVPRVEHVELVTQIGPVVRTERVPRSALARDDAARPSEPALPALRPPATRPSEPALPALRPPATRPSEPVLRVEPRAERRSEPALRPPATRPSEPALPAAQMRRAVAVESAQPAEPDPAPPRLEPKSWGGRILLPDALAKPVGWTPTPIARTPAPTGDPVAALTSAPLARTPAPAAKPIARPPAPGGKPKRSRGEAIARVMYFLSGGLIAVAVIVYGGRLWSEVHPHVGPAPVAPTPLPAAAVIAAGGRIELSADRHTVTRLAGGAARWTAPVASALESLELTGPLVLGHVAETIVALDLESGRTRFTWPLPAGERWATQRPAAVGDCFLAVTTRDQKTQVHCLDLATGAARWTAALPAHDCTQPATAMPGALLVPCSGWAAVIDDRNGTVTTMPGGVGLVQDQPPTLLRTGARLVTMPWSATKHRFTQTGDQTYGTLAVASSSAVLHKDRLVLRATDTSDDLAVVVPRDGAAVPVTAPAYRLADAAPLVHSCGGDASPRFQLLQLAPRVGASFDPSTAADRALALLDVETGALTWTSRKVTGLHPGRAGEPPICRGGHYFVAIDLADRTGVPTSALWIVDAETGKTAAAVAFDAALGARVGDVTADQLDGDRVVGLGTAGGFELAWRTPGASGAAGSGSAVGSAGARGPGLHDARGDLEATLGPLP